MVERISRIQQFLAESKFVEAQKEVELILYQTKSSDSTELLELYFESLKAQSKPLPSHLLLTLIDNLLPQNPQKAQEWFKQIQSIHNKDQQKLLIIKMRIADLKGQTDILYRHISEFQISCYELKIPYLPVLVRSLTSKYFPSDFQLKLQRLALDLMRMDLRICESLIQDLILSCFERSTPRGTREKMELLLSILDSAEKLHHLEMYRNLCSLIVSGIKEKKDFKKVVELIIYAEDFKFQILLLNILMLEGLEEVAADYALEIKENKDYDYVYLDKFLPHLKKLFFTKKVSEKEEVSAEAPEIDLKVSKTSKATFADDQADEESEDEVLLAHMLKHQNLSTEELMDIAVSLLQSEFYHVALKATQLAYENSKSLSQKLKTSYLVITCLLHTGDYRLAIDYSFNALTFAQTQNDILSFMYSQAEAYLRLKEYTAAKAVLSKIISIDSNYRLAKERLEKLNAI